MTGGETTRQILMTLENWIEEYVPIPQQNEALQVLLSRLQQIKGNKSFRDTVSALSQMYKE